MSWIKVKNIKKLIASFLSLIIIIANPLVAKSDSLQTEQPSTYRSMSATGTSTSVETSMIASYSNKGPMANIASGNQLGYDAKGNKLSVTDPNGNITSYVYDQESNLTSQTDPVGNKTLY